MSELKTFKTSDQILFDTLRTSVTEADSVFRATRLSKGGEPLPSTTDATHCVMDPAVRELQEKVKAHIAAFSSQKNR